VRTSPTEVTMAEIGPRRKRTVQEPLREPSRDPLRKPARKHKPQRKVRAPA
jgi:hypothetical protein